MVMVFLAALLLSLVAASPVYARSPDELNKDEVEMLKRQHGFRGESRAVEYDSKINSALKTLERGEVTSTQYYLGAFVSTIVGFGLGHAIEKRYSTRGCFFTATEGALLAAAYVANDANPSRLWREGGIQKGIVVAFVALRLWEAIDSWVEPPNHNEDYRRIRDQMSGRIQSRIHLLPGTEKTPLGMSLALSF